MLRAAIFTQAAEGSVIQISSPKPHDGSTTIAANLAASLSQAGKRVLLVDGDLRTPRIHELFSIENQVGLSSVLLGERSFEEAVAGTRLDDLDVLPAGPVPPHPGELLTQPRLAQFLNLVRDEYDFVLIDSPPLLRWSDAFSIAMQVDYLLMNVAPVKNSRLEVHTCREKLVANRVPVLGVIINKSTWSGVTRFYSSASAQNFQPVVHRMGVRRNGNKPEPQGVVS